MSSALLAFCAIWWLVASLIGLALGGRAVEAIRGTLASARSQTTLPELHPARTLVKLLLCAVGAAVLRVWEPQVAAVAAGFAIVWALSWRWQEHAMAAGEKRDGVRFYVDRTSPFSPIRLIRTPGFGGRFLASR